MSAYLYPQRRWDEIAGGEELPTTYDEITFTRVASALSATLDYLPLHHDPSYARAQGHPDIILSTIQIMGLVDRVGTDWAGPYSFVARRKLEMRAPIYPGDRLQSTGRVHGKRLSEPEGAALVDMDITITKQGGVICTQAELTLQLPRGG